MHLSDPISVVIPSLEGQVLRVLAHATAPLSGSRIAELVTTGSRMAGATVHAYLLWAQGDCEGSVDDCPGRGR